VRIKGARISGITISDNPGMPVTLRDGLANIAIDARLSGSSIDARMHTLIQSAVFITEAGEDTGGIARAIASALSGISRFSLAANLSGTFDDPRITMSSDMDKVLNDAVKTLVAEQAERVRRNLESAINARVEEPMGALTAAMGTMDGFDGEIQKRKDMLENVLGDAMKQKGGGIKLPF